MQSFAYKIVFFFCAFRIHFFRCYLHGFSSNRNTYFLQCRRRRRRRFFFFSLVVVATTVVNSFWTVLPFSVHRIRQLSDRLMPGTVANRFFAIDNLALSASQFQISFRMKKSKSWGEKRVDRNVGWNLLCFDIIFN